MGGVDNTPFLSKIPLVGEPPQNQIAKNEHHIVGGTKKKRE
jgi:hypothetical protein